MIEFEFVAETLYQYLRTDQELEKFIHSFENWKRGIIQTGDTHKWGLTLFPFISAVRFFVYSTSRFVLPSQDKTLQFPGFQILQNLTKPKDKNLKNLKIDHFGGRGKVFLKFFRDQSYVFELVDHIVLR